MSNIAYEEAEPDEREHFIQCGACGEWFDCRSLDEVFKHETDHKDRPDIQYGGCDK